MPSTRKTKFERKLIISIDIGTTYTAASYCIVGDASPHFQEINRWPKQAFSDAKIPSVIYYDAQNVPQLHGAEAEDEESLMEAEEEGWNRAEWWKLQLRPEYLPMPAGFTLAPLPDGITVDKVFCDQFAYVMKNIRAFIFKSHGCSEECWEELISSMVVVLTTPNGWEGKHQHRMRLAAVRAGLVTEANQNRVRFVTEGEAAVHFTLENSKLRHSISVGKNILVCDAGGGTTDMCVYQLNHLSPINIEEITSPRCFVAGGVFVSSAARQHIARKLKGSKWDNPMTIDNAVRTFDQQVKRRFTGSLDALIKLDGSNDTDKARAVQGGRLKISKNDMFGFFDPLIQKIIDGIEETATAVDWSVDQIILVGGFAESEYVFNKITAWANDVKIPIAKPDGVLSKAIAHGALSWQMHSGVQSRMAKLHYGAETTYDFSPHNPDMVGRQKNKNIRGQWKVRHGWQFIVHKNQRLKVGYNHIAWFHLDFAEGDDFEIEMELFAYRFQEPPAFFRNIDGSLVEGFIHIGTVKGDLSRYYGSEKAKLSSTGKRFKTLQYEVCLCFDEIELQARLRWKEKGKSVFGKATISYDV